MVPHGGVGADLLLGARRIWGRDDGVQGAKGGDAAKHGIALEYAAGGGAVVGLAIRRRESSHRSAVLVLTEPSHCFVGRVCGGEV